MTTEFADFVSAQDARNEIELNVIKHCWTLCDKLKENYIEYSKRLIEKLAVVDGSEISPYHTAKLEKLNRGESDYEFELDSSGRKYHKIWEVINRDGDSSPTRSCHAFVDKKTGGVYKAASWKAPAKGVRFNLNIIKEREWLFDNADWAGSYLYVR